MNAAARCMEAVEREVEAAEPAVDADHAEVRWVLALFRSGQYRPADHAPTVRAIARKFSDHPDEEVRSIAGQLNAAVGSYRVN